LMGDGCDVRRRSLMQEQLIAKREERQIHQRIPERINVPKGLYINLLRFIQWKYKQRVTRKWNSFYSEDFAKVAYLRSPEIVVLLVHDGKSGRMNQISVKLSDLEVPSPPQRIDIPHEHYATVYRFVKRFAGAIYRRGNEFYSERDRSVVAEILSPEMLGVIVKRRVGLFAKTLIQEISIPLLTKVLRATYSYDMGHGLAEKEIDYLLAKWKDDLSREPRRSGIFQSRRHWKGINILDTLPVFKGKAPQEEEIRTREASKVSLIEVAEIEIDGETLTKEEKLEVMKKLEINAIPSESQAIDVKNAEPAFAPIPHIPLQGLFARNIGKIRGRIESIEEEWSLGKSESRLKRIEGHLSSKDHIEY
jgi:hypothetical protein